MRTGHLFAGIDGLGLGLEPHGFQTAWFSEYEPAPSRLLAHHYPDVPNHGDITQIDWTRVEPVDVLTGGFPCQDLSYAGRGAGIAEGTRSGLWSEYVRAIRALRPRLVIVENVSALLTRGLGIVLADLHACGFDAEWSTLRASDVGAAHRRERLFLVATATDRDVLGHLHGEPRLDAAEAGVDVLRHASAGSDTDAARTAAQDTDVEPWKQRRVAAPGQAEGGRARAEPAGRGRASAADGGDDGLVRGTEPHLGADQLGQQAPRRGDPVGRRVDAGGTDWGEFDRAIRRWERTLGRLAPAPAVGGRLSPEFVEWHMGFPEGWTAMLSRTERLKALGNAVVPQCADVVGRWALELDRAEVAA